jgi:hypothetical protein
MRGSWQFVVYVENHEPCYFTDKDEAFQYYHNALNNLQGYVEIDMVQFSI